MNIDEISIHIHPGADGRKFWSEIVQAGVPHSRTIWEQIETSETRQEAFDRAENALDKMIAAEQETEELAQTNDEKQRDVGVNNKSFLY